jgi:uncharacterized membrane protein
MQQIKIDAIEEKKTQDGRSYWLVDSEGKRYICWDKKITLAEAGDTIEAEVVKKEGTDFAGNQVVRYYLQFPKEKKTKKTEDKREMLLSYAKDIEIAILNKTTTEKPLSVILDEIETIYNKLANIIKGGETNE